MPLIDTIQTEIQQSRQHRLRALAKQELFQIVISERRELDVNLSDNADLLFRAEILHLNLRKPLTDERIHHADILIANQLISAEVLCDFIEQLIHCLLAVTLVHLIRAALVKDVHDKVTEQHAVSDLNKRLSRQLKARICVFLQAGEVQRDDRNIPHAVFDECLAQQMNVIGRTAAAARLR